MTKAGVTRADREEQLGVFTAAFALSHPGGMTDVDGDETMDTPLTGEDSEHGSAVLTGQLQAPLPPMRKVCVGDGENPNAAEQIAGWSTGMAVPEGKAESSWIASSEATSYPALPGDIEVDVAVVAGGIAGIAAQRTGTVHAQ